jgi:hypothetical protein
MELLMMSTSGRSYPLFVRCSVVVLGSVLSPLYSSHIKGEFPCRKVSLDKATTTGGCQETGGGEGWFVLVPFTTITFIYHSVIISFGEISVFLGLAEFFGCMFYVWGCEA